jgi:hypothetical protein
MQQGKEIRGVPPTSHLCRTIVEVRIKLVNDRSKLINGTHTDPVGIVDDD